MNNYQLEKKDWNKMKQIAKEKWENITEEDFRKADGSIFKLYGIIRVKLSDTGKLRKRTPDHTD